MVNGIFCFGYVSLNYVGFEEKISGESLSCWNEFLGCLSFFFENWLMGSKVLVVEVNFIFEVLFFLILIFIDKC